MTLAQSPLLIKFSKKLIKNRFIILFTLLFGAYALANAVDFKETNSIALLTAQQSQLLKNQGKDGKSFHSISYNFENQNAFFIEPNVENEEDEKLNYLKKKLLNNELSSSILPLDGIKRLSYLHSFHSTSKKAFSSFSSKLYLVLSAFRI